MKGLFDLRAMELRTSLAETIAWCATQQITAMPEETEDVKRRRRAIEEARELRMRAFKNPRGFWDRLYRRSYEKSSDWKLGTELLRQSDLHSLPLSLASQLRTPALNTSRRIGDIQSGEEKKTLVASVVEKRRDLLRAQEVPAPPGLGDGLAGGRMLLYGPDDQVADGASEYASNGFFDWCDAPPWDLWVADSEDTLLTWVPPRLLGLAQRGIDVNAVDCIAWLS